MTDERPTVALRRLIDGFKISQALHVAATLRIADHLADGPRTSDELAESTQAHPGALRRLLGALASVGVMRAHEGDRFGLTEIGDGLRSDADEPLGAWARFSGADPTWQTWGALLHSVRTGESAFAHVHGQPAWEYRVSHPEAAARFDDAMTDLSRRTNRDVLEAYDFGGFGTVVDVGGGHGALLAAILVRHPGVRGVLFDLPHVARAPEDPALRDRLTVVTGSFFDAVPRGGDAYLLKAILHDWDDEDAVRILRRVREAMDGAGAVLVVERDLGGADPETHVSDLNMLVSLGGRERSVEEYAALMERAGLRFVAATPARYGLHVIEGRPD